MQIISKYFPGLTDAQTEQFQAMGKLYEEWNSRINVISRQDIVHLYERHILYSLSIAKLVPLPAGSAILDAGTGGGFPGIPLAVIFPEVRFTLADATAKKIKVTDDIARNLGLRNVRAIQGRLEDLHDRFDFVVGRALADLPTLIRWTLKNVKRGKMNGIERGIFYLKGGEFMDELKGSGMAFRLYRLSEIFSEEYFMTKKLVHLWPA